MTVRMLPILSKKWKTGILWRNFYLHNSFKSLFENKAIFSPLNNNSVDSNSDNLPISVCLNARTREITPNVDGSKYEILITEVTCCKIVICQENFVAMSEVYILMT